jgi:hypothetical protein
LLLTLEKGNTYDGKEREEGKRYNLWAIHQWMQIEVSKALQTMKVGKEK